MDRYLGGEEIDEKVLVADLERAVARATFFPVVPVCSVTGVGCAELLDLAVRAFPSPPEHPSPEVFTPAGKPAGADHLRPRRAAGRRGGEDHQRPVRRPAQPGAGVLRHAAARRHGARLRATSRRSSARTPATPTTTRTSRSARSPTRSASAQAPATAVVAGDICAIGRLTRAETGDTLSDGRRPAGAAAVVAARAAAADRDRGRAARPTRTSSPRRCGRLAAEDPTLRVENNAETHQLVLWCMGEAHADVVLERLAERYSRPRRPGAVPGVAARDVRRQGERARAGTSSSPAGTASTPSATSRSSRCPRASGFEFVDKVVGGAVPRQFIPSVEKGVRAQMERGVRARLPGRRPAGHPHRRQVAQRRLLRHGLPDRRRARAARGGRGHARSPCWSRSTRST